MPARKSKRDVVSEFRRRAILDAARSVFSRKPFATALVDDIADEAGIAKGTVYLYFRSKDEIYAAALVEDVRALCAQSTRSVKDVTGTMNKLRAFAAERVKFFENNQEFFRIYYSEFGARLTRSKRIPEELRAPYKQQLRLLESVLEDGVRRKEIRRVPVDLAASAIYDLTRAMIERRLLSRPKNLPDEDLEFLMDFLWRGLRPAPRMNAMRRHDA